MSSVSTAAAGVASFSIAPRHPHFNLPRLQQPEKKVRQTQTTRGFSVQFAPDDFCADFFKASLRLENEPQGNLDEMASELEGLIAGLLVHISCAGEQGKFD